MTDKELADKVVALGVGGHWDDRGYRYRLGITDKLSVDAYAFVRAWRVAGALIQKLCDSSPWGSMVLNPSGESYNAYCETRKTEYSKARNAHTKQESLPRAINEACVEVLTND